MPGATEYPRDPEEHRPREGGNWAMLLLSVVLFGVLALVVAAFAQTPESGPAALPIDPNNASPNTVLSEAAGVDISSPIRPTDITGIGYHPAGESRIEMEPRGENLSGGALPGVFGTGSTPENLRYHMMDPAERPGPPTGAVDVGARAGDPVYAPVSGEVTGVRPDPTLEGASVVEIQPSASEELRVAVYLVGDPGEEAEPGTATTAGMTRLGETADASSVLEPQLASYAPEAANHVTVSVTEAG